MIRRLLHLFLIVLGFVVLLLGQSPVKADLTVEARSAILLEPSTGKILFTQNEHQRLPPASITKTMTMLLVLEAIAEGKLNWNDPVITSRNAARMGGSQIYLKEGEILTVKELFKAVVVKSANDASTALAEHLAGSTEAFVAAMNRKAKALGLQNTNFVNVTGLPAPDHYSSAYDLAIISRELLLKHPEVLQFTTITTDYLRDGQFVLKNTNELITVYYGADGLKTGYTQEALYCLAATAKRNGFRLLSVILGAETNEARVSQSCRLLDYGYQNYCWETIFTSKAAIGRVYIKQARSEYIPVRVKSDFGVVVAKAQKDALKVRYNVQKGLSFPLATGALVGTASVILEGQEIAQTPIYSVEPVTKANWFIIGWRSVRDFFRELFGTD
ncbi:MAG TPA: D-alanyl-D-alanine carboxypeptidase family protein [Bacillota bacterium]|jgi:D-alanyl-D-alanine carboxypeptidase (penicillin-binding protein 5/6)|nr:D-alanyl-D-alanine carboxypeptidase family protein [Bacillota bacterium]HOL09594.1 D-alanyl-D-alanine carboxypeptidase family protein [Bacillota bacterium]HPO97245.1 D-alanyl-D-alanine carboxypeptidase family protein [Bacillota bacterium]